MEPSDPPVQQARIRGAGELDDVTRALIEQLQRDGRQSYASLAKEVGLSETAVRQRVQRLISEGFMQIVAVTDPLQVGFRRQAMVGVRTSGNILAVAEQIAEIPEAAYVVVSGGAYDILIELVCEDDDHLLEVLTERIRSIEGVVSTEAHFYLKLVKQSYHWGTR